MNIALRQSREQSKKTQAEIATEVLITERSYRRIEYDKQEPNVRTAIRIASALKIKTLKEFKTLFGAATPK